MATGEIIELDKKVEARKLLDCQRHARDSWDPGLESLQYISALFRKDGREC